MKDNVDDYHRSGRPRFPGTNNVETYLSFLITFSQSVECVTAEKIVRRLENVLHAEGGGGTLSGMWSEVCRQMYCT